jgi:hypothetical protein
VTDAADDDDSSASSTYSCGGSDSDVECNPWEDRVFGKNYHNYGTGKTYDISSR